jgi:Mycothiol maleylpyruvate isomerase N-terminal domain
VDYVAHFGREVAAFETAARAALGAQPAPAVSSCPGWRVTNLVLHLGTVHRYVARVIAGRLQEPPPEGEDLAWLAVPGECAGWLPPGEVPGGAALPATLLDWFAVGAAGLRAQFQEAGPDEAVWTWSADHTVGFWQRMQATGAMRRARSARPDRWTPRSPPTRSARRSRSWPRCAAP